MLVALLGAVVICGWFLNITPVKNVLPGLATMKMNTAVCLLLAGVSLWLLHTSAAGSPLFPVARGLAVIVVVVGGATLYQDIFDHDFGVDELLIRDFSALAIAAPGRMSPASAFNFIFVGLALLSLKAHRYNIAVLAHWFVAPVLFVATLAIVGYAYGVNELYRVGLYTSMALHTAVAFFVLAVAILAANLKFGFARVATSETVGGLVSRWLLPNIPITLFLLGWLRLKGELAGLYGFQFGLALMVLMSITVCVVSLAWVAIVLHGIDINRKRAEAEIMSLNASLERRVNERTEELERVSERLKETNAVLERLSLQDGLTELANRRHFDLYLIRQQAVARRHERSLAVVLCDVDHFKAYNDHYGHQAGDECLKRVAAALRSCCQRPADMIARYGGEEFAMILPDTDLAGAMRVAEAAREAVALLKIPHGYSKAAPYVSVSGGVAAKLVTKDFRAKYLVAAADRSLYAAKHRGRNRVVCAPPLAA